MEGEDPSLRAVLKFENFANRRFQSTRKKINSKKLAPY